MIKPVFAKAKKKYMVEGFFAKLSLSSFLILKWYVREYTVIGMNTISLKAGLVYMLKELFEFAKALVEVGFYFMLIAGCIVGFYEKRELSPEEIAGKFDISERDVYAALVYYYENPKDIRRQIYNNESSNDVVA